MLNRLSAIISLATLTTFSQAMANIRQQIENQLPEIRSKVVLKYPELKAEQIKLFSIQYNYTEPEISKIFEASSAMFQEQTRILFVTNDKPSVSEKGESKELAIEGIMVTLDNEKLIKNIEKGFHTRSAFKKPDGAFGEYSTLGFSSERSYRYAQSGGAPVRQVNKMVDPGSIKIDWGKTNLGLQEKADQGDAESQYRLAMNLSLGLGFEKTSDNLNKAKMLLQKAAEQGYDPKKIHQVESIIKNQQSSSNPQ